LKRVVRGGNIIKEIPHPKIKGVTVFVGWDRKGRWCKHYHETLEEATTCLKDLYGSKKRVRVVKSDDLRIRATRQHRNKARR
jgi:hypothetical protein